MATGENYPDALAASTWAYSQQMPIILCGKNGLSAEAWSLVNSFAKVYIVGGVNAVRDSNLTALEQSGKATRLSGATRYETSLAIARTFAGGNVTDYVFATGENFPDALCGASLAGTKTAPIILVGKTAAGNAGVNAYLKSSKGQDAARYYLGGTAAISDDVKTALSRQFG